MTKNNKFTRRAVLKRLAPVLVLTPGIRFPFSLFSNSAGKEGFIDLFDGRSLSGWHTNRQKSVHGTGGRWQVQDGVLTGEQDPPGSGNGGILMTDQTFGDFELMLDLAPDWGVDSGVFLRTTPDGQCFQVYVDYHDNGHIGSVSTETSDGRNRMINRPFNIYGLFDQDGNLNGFETRPDARDHAKRPDSLLYQCTPEQWKSAWKIGEWNTLRIRCTGKYPRITTWINNTKIVDFDGETSPHPRYDKEQLFGILGREGSIGLQVHGGQSMWPEGARCRWKNIRIKPL